MANRLFARLPHIHHEAGFGKEETERQLTRRILLRRVALREARQIVVPSRTLERIALDVWQFQKHRVAYVPNGIDDERFVTARRPARRSDRGSSIVIGSLAPLRPEKNISRLLSAFAFAHERAPVRLMIAGDGADRTKLEAQARELGVAHAVQFLGAVDRPESVLSEVDIVALSSDTEQMPNSVLEAMAAALPVVSPDVGDIREMLAPENAPFVVARNDGTALGRASYKPSLTTLSYAWKLVQPTWHAYSSNLHTQPWSIAGDPSLLKRFAAWAPDNTHATRSR